MAIHVETKILYIKPESAPSSKPVIDSITRKLTAALRHPIEDGIIMNGNFVANSYSLGCYKCTCGKATYAAQDFRISEDLITNSVALHYVVYHRKDIPNDELSLLMELVKEEEPDALDLELQ